jgi:hypothetical protein
MTVPPDVFHRESVVGDRHAPHNLEYPDAASREAGINEGRGFELAAGLLYQFARQTDDNSLWMLVGYDPIAWVPVGGAGDTTLDDAYSNGETGDHLVDVDDGPVIWRLADGENFRVDAGGDGEGVPVSVIEDGDCEAADMSAWTLVGSPAKSSAYAHGGSQAIEFYSGTSEVAQGGLVVGLEYRVRFWALRDGMGSFVVYNGSGGSEVFLGELIMGDLYTWYEFDKIFTATSDTIRIVGTGFGLRYIDDISVVGTGGGTPATLNDGDCEAADMSAWTASGGPSKSTDYAHGGTRSIRFGASPAEVSQSCITPGTEYRLRFWGLKNGTHTGFSVYDGSSETGTLLGTLSQASADVWYEFDHTFTAATDTVTIAAGSLDGAAYIDDVTIVNTGGSAAGYFQLTSSGTALGLSALLSSVGIVASGNVVIESTGGNVDIGIMHGEGAGYQYAREIYNATQSAGVISGGGITDNLDGTVDIEEIEVIFKTTDSETGANETHTIPAQTDVEFTDHAKNFILLDYNGGSPSVSVSTSDTSNGHDVIELACVFREGTNLDIFRCGLTVSDLANRLAYLHELEDGLHFVTGGHVSDAGTRYIEITAGIMIKGLVEIVSNAFDSTGEAFEYYYEYPPSTWVETSAQQLNNAQYNDPAAGLVAHTANRYGTHWVYKGTNGNTYVLYGRGDYLLAQAQAAQPPATLPPHVESFGVLRAKVITQQGAAEIVEIQAVDDVQFTYSTPSVHNELSGLQGGVAGSYYHSDQAINAASSPTFAGLTVSGLIYANGNITKAPGSVLSIYGGNSYVRIGDTAVTSHLLDSENDLLIGGELEVDGATYLDGSLTISGLITSSNSMYMGGNQRVYAGAGLSFYPYISTQTVGSGYIGTDANNLLLFGRQANVGGNYGFSAPANPTFYILSASAATTATDQWGRWYHDQSDFRIGAGKGATLVDGPAAGCGIGFPSMTTANRTSYSPSRAGVLVWDSDLSDLQRWDGTYWDGLMRVNTAPVADTTGNGITARVTVTTNTVGIGGALTVDSSFQWVDADNTDPSTAPCLAIALEAGTGAGKKVLLLGTGVIRKDAWDWSRGYVYVGTSGGLTQTAPSGSGDQVQPVGYALSADTILIGGGLAALVEV